ncbi:helix-turn-helix transcriptional regulator [Rubellimicrobium roseum]|uniref:AlpA family phage regulatory protein n=1 Tax=Rubellimicrobium roseum TaxID=687525 RepID=A0A5C4N446_9RHOB|nr:AlpA family phage regulatory protein [Rubellimicrobium roseum]TNC61832.1 AlpA family phage regulatory protein [Rubellimicrobium roseum]
MIEKHLNRREVEEIVGLSRASIYRLMERGEFPRPVRVTSKAVRWPESSIAQWIVERAQVAS